MFKGWIFLIFYEQTSRFGYWVHDWELAIKSKDLRNFLKISQFSVGCFRADFFQLFTKQRENIAIGLTVGNSPSNQGISGSSLKILNILWKVLGLICCNFYQEISKFSFCVEGLELVIKSKHFRKFFQIF